jgi:hypothetical protein
MVSGSALEAFNPNFSRTCEEKFRRRGKPINAAHYADK